MDDLFSLSNSEIYKLSFDTKAVWMGRLSNKFESFYQTPVLCLNFPMTTKGLRKFQYCLKWLISYKEISFLEMSVCFMYYLITLALSGLGYLML